MKHGTDDQTRLVSIREALTAANGDWQNIVALWSINADLTWLLERAERATPAGVLDEAALRERIGAVIDRWYHLGLIRFNSRDDGSDDLILRDELYAAALGRSGSDR